jgi:membrane fusion protein, multidrug efflux system
MEEQDPKSYAPRKPGAFFYAGWAGLVVLALAVTAGLIIGRKLWLHRETVKLERDAALGPRVLVTPVLRAPKSRSLALPGSIHGYIETPVYAKVPGYLKTIRVDKGDRVKKGEVIAVLESPEIDHQVSNARANYNFALVTDRRNQSLLARGVIARQAADESHAAMLQARAALRQLESMQAYEIIKASFSGMITARYVDPGTLIPEATAPSTANTPIVSMATLQPVRVYTNVPQSIAPFIRNGDSAIVTVAQYPRREFEGTITRHPEALMSATRTMLVEVDLPNRNLALYPGMYATVEFTVAMPSGVPMVPDDALIFRDGKVYVPTVRNDRLRLAEVTLGYDNGMTVEVTRGVSYDDLVAINVGQSARDGEAVRLLMSKRR